ncbi:alpha/beta fold hydrolase [Nonomuraea sp. NPDC048826]|uniref:alpha/beta fold hydrolase n=1 Tax=Nonomuraea sp. NPDC048826 TaxID=3364347 RepID=UPI0037223D0E
MPRVTSCDGTSIAYRRKGTGPAVVLAGFPDRAAALLAERFTVYSYDRRGTGGSGNTTPYAVAREVEDLAAVVAAAGDIAHSRDTATAGGTVALAGWGPGAVLALEAARLLPSLTALAVTGLGPLVPTSRPEHAHPESVRTSVGHAETRSTRTEDALRQLISEAESPIPAELAAARWSWLAVPVLVLGNPALAAVLSEGRARSPMVMREPRG